MEKVGLKTYQVKLVGDERKWTIDEVSWSNTVTSKPRVVVAWEEG